MFAAQQTEATKLRERYGSPQELMGLQSSLLLNSAGPMPHKLPNQRQRRKLHRQVPQLRK